MHRSQKLVGDADQEYSNEKRVVNLRVDGMLRHDSNVPFSPK